MFFCWRALFSGSLRSWLGVHGFGQRRHDRPDRLRNRLPTPPATSRGRTAGRRPARSTWRSPPSPPSPTAADYGFGTQALRTSNAVTSGSFGHQTFSPKGSTTRPASPAPHRICSLRASRSARRRPTFQPDLYLSVSPDDGTGGRMSYLRFEDQSDGVHVFFDDTTVPGGFGTPADFNETDLVTLSRTLSHTIKFTITFVDGPNHDVVRVYVDGVAQGGPARPGRTTTATTRSSRERQPGAVDLQSPLPRGGSGVYPALQGQGFLIDDVSLELPPPRSAPDAYSDDTGTHTKDTDRRLHDGPTPSSFRTAGRSTETGHTITAVDPSAGTSSAPSSGTPAPSPS